MNIFGSLRERFGALVGAVVSAIVLFGCGLLFLLVLAPQQKLEARRLEQLPLMDVQYAERAAPGDELLLSGRLSGDPLPDVGEFIAYELEQWDVTLPDPDEAGDTPSGTWKSQHVRSPEMNLMMGAEDVLILAGSGVNFSGSLHEAVVPSNGNQGADYEGQWLAEGSQRYRGFHDGDLATVWGKKASAGGVIPDEIFAGDRVAFVESKHAAAKGLMIAGIAMLTCSPLALIGGIFSAIFGKRRR